MKLYATLIFIAISMAFATGYFALFFQTPQNPSTSDIYEIQRLKLSYQRENKAKSVVNFKKIYSNNLYGYSSDLVNKKYSVSSDLVTETANSVNHPRYSSSKKCFVDPFLLFSSLHSSKVWIWEEFRCNKRKSLPKNFFKNPPYMHPSGRSFAFLAFMSGKSDFNELAWKKGNLSYFHLSEFFRIKEIFKDFDSELSIIYDMDKNSLMSLVKRKDTLVFNDNILFKVKNIFDLSSMSYRIYSLKEFKEFLKLSPFSISKDVKKKSCLYIGDGCCWTYNFKHLYKISNKSTLFFFSGSLLIIVLVVILLLNKVRGQRLEDERTRFALRVLTHEFRTPVSSMLLQLERGYKEFGAMSDNMQQVFTRLSRDVYRLQRLTETSRKYLRTREGKKLINFNFDEILSVNEFFRQYIEEFLDKELSFSPLESDKSVKFDSYWIGICVKNLLENAYSHGMPPVKVSLESSGQYIKFIVEDSGSININKRNDIFSPFIKGPNSKGTGLGLNIVKQVAREMGGKIIVNTNPTRFILLIKDRS